MIDAKDKLKSKNIHENHRQRMRKKMEGSVENFSDHELLEVLLYLTYSRRDTNEIAHNLINRFKNLKGVLGADKSEIMSVDGVGEKCALYIKILNEFYKRANLQKVENKKLNTTASLFAFLRELFAMDTKENFYAICLDGGFNLITALKMNTSSTSTSATIDVSECVNKISLNRAKNVILAHNHIDCNVIPTQDDYNTTLNLTSKLFTLGIKVVDHIIVNEKDFFSFFENKFMQKIYERITKLPYAESYKKLSLTQVASGGVILPDDDFGIMF